MPGWIADCKSPGKRQVLREFLSKKLPKGSIQTQNNCRRLLFAPPRPQHWNSLMAGNERCTWTRAAGRCWERLHVRPEAFSQLLNASTAAWEVNSELALDGRSLERAIYCSSFWSQADFTYGSRRSGYGSPSGRQSGSGAESQDARGTGTGTT